MKLFNHNGEIPDMPKNADERNKAIWQALFNHVPHRLWALEFKQRFILGLVSIILAMAGVILGLIAMLSARIP